jgi:hypothetical protein
MDDSAENSPLHLDYQLVGEHVACAPKNKATQGIFNCGDIGVLVYMHLTVHSACVPPFTISVPFSERQMWLWRTFALAWKTSGTVDCPVSFSSIED